MGGYRRERERLCKMKPGYHQVTLWLSAEQLRLADREARRRKLPRATTIKKLIEESGKNRRRPR